MPTDGVKKSRTSTPPPRAKTTGAKDAANKVGQQKPAANLQKPGTQGKATAGKLSSFLATIKEKVFARSRLIAAVVTIGLFIAVAAFMSKNHAYVTAWCRQAFERLSSLTVSDVSAEASKIVDVVWTSLQRAVQTVMKQPWKDITLLPWTKIAAVVAAIVVPIGAGRGLKKPIGEKWAKVKSCGCAWFRTKRTAA